MKRKGEKKLSPAIRIIIIFGIISMLGDILYETGRSANSQYFSLLGISAAKVGFVFGIGEFLGYGLRLLSGLASDKTGKYWRFLFVGYGLLFVLPLMGITGNWNLLCILVLMERIGKALRSPAKDTILSAVAQDQVGLGMAFGLQEALDQIGAFMGPLFFTGAFYFLGKSGLIEYQFSYRLLIIPYIILMVFLYYAYTRVNRENFIENVEKKAFKKEKLPPLFWYYSAFTFFCTLGFLNFSTIGYHLKIQKIMTDGNITLLYSLAMFMDALAALVMGKWYDHRKEKTQKKEAGLLLLIALPLLSLLLPLLTLSNNSLYIGLGMLVFGLIVGAQETIMRSAIADISPFYKRGTSYGIFNALYGLALFFGASLSGFFYDRGNISLIFSLTLLAELIALLLFYLMRQELKKKSVAKF